MSEWLFLPFLPPHASAAVETRDSRAGHVLRSGQNSKTHLARGLRFRRPGNRPRPAEASPGPLYDALRAVGGPQMRRGEAVRMGSIHLARWDEEEDA